MEKYLMLKVRQENWGLIPPETWHERVWHVWSDRSYSVGIGFGPGVKRLAPVEKTGVMRKDRFVRLCSALEEKWTESVLEAAACDGEAWQIDQYAPDGSILMSNGGPEYIYGKEKIEQIIDLLPGWTFVRDHYYTSGRIYD